MFFWQVHGVEFGGGDFVGQDMQKVVQYAITGKIIYQEHSTIPTLTSQADAKAKYALLNLLPQTQSYPDINLRICRIGYFIGTRHILQVDVAVIKVQLQAFITQGLL